MKNLNAIIFVVIIIFISNSCNNQLSDPTYLGKGFKGITFTDETGEIVGNKDESDWGKKRLTGSLHTYYFDPAYPNPINSSESFNLILRIPKSTTINIYMINKEEQIVKNIIVSKALAAGIHKVTVDTDNLPPSIYRVIFETESFSIKGDIWIKGNWYG